MSVAWEIAYIFHNGKTFYADPRNPLIQMDADELGKRVLTIINGSKHFMCRCERAYLSPDVFPVVMPFPCP